MCKLSSFLSVRIFEATVTHLNSCTHLSRVILLKAQVFLDILRGRLAYR